MSFRTKVRNLYSGFPVARAKAENAGQIWWGEIRKRRGNMSVIFSDSVNSGPAVGTKRRAHPTRLTDFRFIRQWWLTDNGLSPLLSMILAVVKQPYSLFKTRPRSFQKSSKHS